MYDSITLFITILVSKFSFLADDVDLDVIQHIKDQLVNQSHVMAATIYQVATHKDMLPRKPLPAALPPK